MLKNGTIISIKILTSLNDFVILKSIRSPNITTQSKKAKGRNLQKTVRDALLKLGEPYGLEPGDVRSTSMGASGVDVIMSPAAKKMLGDLAIECKNQESLSVPKTYFDHAAKYKQSFNILVHKKNKSEPLVTITLADFITLLGKTIS